MSLALTASLFWAIGINGQIVDTSLLNADLDINTIAYIEDEESMDLNFDPYFYLPENFNPYYGMVLELDDIIYLECEEETGLDSGPSILLP
ncbi:hypothetical protein [Ulvibacterium marinum]|uniref:hypothetical protein n=1 Tax=Ulvibacterium marinum TaxID=2419782 RepID=UPI0011C48CDF|nr:hypothetical protein [Ulvibacterium marinum]